MNAAYGYSRRDRDRRMESGLIGICSGAAVFTLLLVALLLIGKLSATPAMRPQSLALACWSVADPAATPYRRASVPPKPALVCEGRALP